MWMFQQSKDVRETIEDLIPHLNRFKHDASAAAIGEDQAEMDRRSELSRYAY